MNKKPKNLEEPPALETVVKAPTVKPAVISEFGRRVQELERKK